VPLEERRSDAGTIAGELSNQSNRGKSMSSSPPIDPASLAAHWISLDPCPLTRKKDFMDEITGPEELSEKVKDKTAEVKETASTAADQARRTAEAAWDEAKSKLSDLQSLEAFIREKPTQAILVTFGMGFLMGLLWHK
jgi:ElaB/YqjD/DUF883 family membrane-anchored ribosome-binding protein